METHVRLIGVGICYQLEKFQKSWYLTLTHIFKVKVADSHKAVPADVPPLVQYPVSHRSCFLVNSLPDRPILKPRSLAASVHGTRRDCINTSYILSRSILTLDCQSLKMSLMSMNRISSQIKRVCLAVCLWIYCSKVNSRRFDSRTVAVYAVRLTIK